MSKESKVTYLYIYYNSPINYLEPKHRLVYVLACGLLASPLLSLIISNGNIELDNRWAEVIVHS